MLAFLRLHRDVDIRQVLPAIHVPTLVLHRASDAYREAGHGRYLGAHIPRAKYVELAGPRPPSPTSGTRMRSRMRWKSS